MELDEWKDKVEGQIAELKLHVSQSCDRRVEKSVLEKHVDAVEVELTTLDGKIDSLLWKGVTGFVAVGACFVILYQWLHYDIEQVKDSEVAYQMEIVKGMAEIKTSLTFLSEDIKAMKEQHHGKVK